MAKPTPQEEMHAFLTGRNPASAVLRRTFRRIPHGTNCKICAAPFAGPGGAVLRHVGFGRYAVISIPVTAQPAQVGSGS